MAELKNKRCGYCNIKPLKCDIVKKYPNGNIRVKCSICFKEQIIIKEIKEKKWQLK